MEPPPWLGSVAGLVLLVVVLLGWYLSARDWVDERFPSQKRRAQVGAEAARLGLRSFKRDASSIDRSFPFLQPARRSYSVASSTGKVLAAFIFILLLVFAFFGTLNLDPVMRPIVFGIIAGFAGSVVVVVLLLDFTRGVLRERFRKKERPEWFAAEATRPGGGRFARIFAGNWKDLDVRIFDYMYSDDDGGGSEWTCAILPIDVTSPALQIARESVISRLKSAFGAKDLMVGDEEFNHTFRVLADSEDAAGHLLDARVRAILMEDAASTEVLIQLHGDRMLYCGMRLPVENRVELLEAAKRLRDAMHANAPKT